MDTLSLIAQLTKLPIALLKDSTIYENIAFWIEFFNQIANSINTLKNDQQIMEKNLLNQSNLLLSPVDISEFEDKVKKWKNRLNTVSLK